MPRNVVAASSYGGIKADTTGSRGSFPVTRMRRLRRTAALRNLVAETTLSASDLVMPLFVAGGADRCDPLPQIPGCNLLAGEPLIAEAKRLRDLAIPAVLLFGVPENSAKNPTADAAFAEDGPTQQAVALLKKHVPDLTAITDLCLCEFTDHGHCGLIRDGRIDNDLTLNCIRRVAVSQARAGADIIAPSGMMDGTVAAIREALDSQGHQEVLTMPYSAKFASGFYGPFKAATDSSPVHSLHATHQLQTGNAREAMREIQLDVDEGADIVIVKPAMPSLDIIFRARAACPVPIAAYQVSGTYAMLWRAGENTESRTRLMMESLTCIKRAGADIIITYFAAEAACILTPR